MKVVMIKDVKDVGKSGEVVNVSEGYARNFLIPRKMAIVADAGAMKNVAARKKADAQKEAALLAEATETANKIKDINLKIEAKVGANSKLYGSVTNAEIAQALSAKHGIKIDKRNISLAEPIKNVGEYDINIKLHHEVACVLHVCVEG